MSINRQTAASLFNGSIVLHYIDVLQLEMIFISSEQGYP